jgi:hypothetical protein
MYGLADVAAVGPAAGLGAATGGAGGAGVRRPPAPAPAPAPAPNGGAARRWTFCAEGLTAAVPLGWVKRGGGICPGGGGGGHC